MTFIFKYKKIKENLLFSKSEYLFEEQSFINREPNDVSLMIDHQYLSLDVSLESNIITGISGYFNISKSFQKTINLLEGENGMIEVVSKSFPFESGIGYSYHIPGESFFDRKKKILQIGEVGHTKKNIKISENIIIGLFEEGITCIQIKIN